MFTKSLTIIALGAFSFVLVGCNMPNSQSDVPLNTSTQENDIKDALVTTPNSETTQSDSNDAVTTDVKVFELDGGMFYYAPNEIRVSEGDTVRIILNNVEGMHDWVIDEFDARTEIGKEGETVEVEFVADKAGTYEFYCSVGQHRANGMVGTLIVE